MDYFIPFGSLGDVNPYTNPDLTYLNGYDVGEILAGELTSTTNGRVAKLGYTSVAPDYTGDVHAEFIVGAHSLNFADSIMGPAILVGSGADTGKGYWLFFSYNGTENKYSFKIKILNVQDGLTTDWTTLYGDSDFYTIAVGDSVILTLHNDNTLSGYLQYNPITNLQGKALTTYPNSPVDLIPAICVYRSSSSVYSTASAFNVYGMEGEAPAVPDPITDLVAQATSSTNIFLTWSASEGATSYLVEASDDGVVWPGGNYEVTIDGGETSLDNPGLPPNTIFYWRISAENANGFSAVSNTASATTYETPSTSGLIFQDDFESYSIGEAIAQKIPPVAVGAAKWDTKKGSECIVGDGGMGGGQCLHFNFVSGLDNTDSTGTGQSFCEQNVMLSSNAATNYRAIWVEFYLNIPDAPRLQESNDKFLSVYQKFTTTGGQSGYGRAGAWFNTWEKGPSQNDRYGTFSLKTYLFDGGAYYDWGHNNDSGGIPPYGPSYEHNGTWRNNWARSATGNPAGSRELVIDAPDAGNWVRYRMYCRFSNENTPDGHMTWWKDDELILDVDQIAQRYDTNVTDIDGFYLLGYFNAGFVDATTWKIDNISVWDADPWSGEPPVPVAVVLGPITADPLATTCLVSLVPSDLGGTYYASARLAADGAFDVSDTDYLKNGLGVWNGSGASNASTLVINATVLDNTTGYYVGVIVDNGEDSNVVSQYFDTLDYIDSVSASVSGSETLRTNDEFRNPATGELFTWDGDSWERVAVYSEWDLVGNKPPDSDWNNNLQEWDDIQTRPADEALFNSNQDWNDIGNVLVDSADINLLAVNEGHIGNLQVSTGKIANLAVGNAKIDGSAAFLTAADAYAENTNYVQYDMPTGLDEQWALWKTYALFNYDMTGRQTGQDMVIHDIITDVLYIKFAATTQAKIEMRVSVNSVLARYYYTAGIVFRDNIPFSTFDAGVEYGFGGWLTTKPTAIEYGGAGTLGTSNLTIPNPISGVNAIRCEYRIETSGAAAATVSFKYDESRAIIVGGRQ